MNLTLNDEQTMLKNGAHEFFKERMPVKALRELRDKDVADGFDRALWAEMAALGWAGILIPEQFGGADFGYKGMGQVMEEAGRSLAASPLVASAALAAPLLLKAGSDAHKQALLPALANGEVLLALAHDEAPRHAPTRIATRVEQGAQGLVLNGCKTFVVDGHVADHFIVVARSSGERDARDGLTLLLVDAEAPGVSVTRTRMVDNRNAALVSFTDVVIGADALLGKVGEAHGALTAALDGARALLAAEMLGNACEAFERTLAYLKLRKQFGAVIGSFQALKHRAAHMFCELELTRSAVLGALDALDNGHADSAALCSLAKAKACDTLELVSAEAVQMHGGIGMTDAEEIGFFLKRARVAQQWLGDASFHRDRYASLMGF
ncbi:MAG: acyl-CoA dehydrogenase family protein [Gammaproteobacteria bacterium]|nr:acyl-CoA dehydrogenase family protein [Gammaproteobacteria bacterium]